MALDWNPRLTRPAVIAAAVAAYFVAFPDDLPSFLTPVERILGLTTAVSPWLYVVLGGALVAWTIVRVFGRRPEFPRP
jgi:hypothetical protein